MSNTALWCGILLITLTSANAETLRIAGLEMPLPTGFAGPHSDQLESGATRMAYIKPYGTISGGTYLQATALPYDGHTTPPQNLRHELLQQFSRGIQHQYWPFSLSTIQDTHFGEKPAALATWEGEQNNKRFTGVLVIFLHQGQVISIHTRDQRGADQHERLAVLNALHRIQWQTGTAPR